MDVTGLTSVTAHTTVTTVITTTTITTTTPFLYCLAALLFNLGELGRR